MMSYSGVMFRKQQRSFQHGHLTRPRHQRGDAPGARAARVFNFSSSPPLAELLDPRVFADLSFCCEEQCRQGGVPCNRVSYRSRQLSLTSVRSDKRKSPAAK